MLPGNLTLDLVRKLDNFGLELSTRRLNGKLSSFRLSDANVEALQAQGLPEESLNLVTRLRTTLSVRADSFERVLYRFSITLLKRSKLLTLFMVVSLGRVASAPEYIRHR